MDEAIDRDGASMSESMSRDATLKQETLRIMEERDVVERSVETVQDETRGRMVSGSRARTSPNQSPRYHALTTDLEGTTTRHALQAYGDDEAIALALSLAHGRSVDIWDGPRLLQRFNARNR